MIHVGAACRVGPLRVLLQQLDVELVEPSPTFDWSVRRDLVPSEVLDVITIDDPRFEALTGYRAWAPEHRIG